MHCPRIRGPGTTLGTADAQFLSAVTDVTAPLVCLNLYKLYNTSPTQVRGDGSQDTENPGRVRKDDVIPLSKMILKKPKQVWVAHTDQSSNITHHSSLGSWGGGMSFSENSSSSSLSSAFRDSLVAPSTSISFRLSMIFCVKSTRYMSSTSSSRTQKSIYGFFALKKTIAGIKKWPYCLTVRPPVNASITDNLQRQQTQNT